MHESITALLSARTGHFRFESGHHGNLWLDLDELWLRPARLMPAVRELGRRLVVHGIEGVCGPASGGAYLACLIAAELDLRFFAAERIIDRRNDDSLDVRYALPDSITHRARGMRLAVVDDVINAGSATGGTLAALDAAGANVIAIGALLVLGETMPAIAAARGLPLEAVARLPNTLWLPETCPLCAAGAPLDSLVR